MTLSPLVATLILTAPAQTLYVQADVLNLRSTPSAKASIVSRLRINTAVVVESERDAWSRVSLAGWPREHAVVGWAPTRFLAKHQINAARATLEMSRAKELKDQRRWAERAYAVAPNEAHVQQQLRRIAEQMGDKARVTLIDNAREGRNDLVVGVCDGQRVVLAGRVRPGDMVIESSWETEKELRAVLRQVQAAAWYEYGSERSYMVPGTPFPRPFLTMATNEEGGTGYQPGNCELGDELCGGEVGILGPCTARNTVYSTFPLAPLHTVGMPAKDLAKIVDAVVAPLGALQLLDFEVNAVAETPWRQVSMTAMATGHYDEPYRATRWILVDARARRVTALGGSFSYRAPRWFRLKIDGVQQHLIIHDVGGEVSSGYGVTLIDPKGEVQHHTAELFSWGC